MKRRVPRAPGRQVLALGFALAVPLGSPGTAAAAPAAPPPTARPQGVPPDPAAVQAGRKLFVRHCAECHGDDARGSRRAPALDSDRVRQMPAEDLFRFVTDGSLGAGMPSWSRLPAARRWQLVTYLRSLPPQPPAAPPLPPPSPPAAHRDPRSSSGRSKGS